ncbi:MAG TPA: MFS transporter [Gaiellales bacterium]|nr:MFS transporter [Gaiellales bacterium]
MDRLTRAFAEIAIDVGPLRRHRDFRLLFIGQAVTFLGSMITYVALPFQAYQLTGSSLVVGALGVAEFAPLILMALVGGALADATDRRRMVQLTELGFAGASGALVVNALTDSPQVWVLFACSIVMAALDGLQRPSLEGLVPRLVERDELPAASALSSFRMTIGMVAGPAIGGVLIATIGLPLTYGLDVATFLFSLAMLRLMRAVPPPRGAEAPSLRRIMEGVRYARSRPDLLGTYIVDIVAMFFGMPMALFPAIADGFGGAGALGLLYAAPSVGSLIATVSSGWTAKVRRHGRAICLAAAGWGAAIVAFGLADNLWVALVFLAVAGGADMISGLFRSVMWNSTIPDELRGRLAGIEQVSYSTGPLLGNVESGVAASLIGVRGAVVSGGLLCVVGVAITAMALPVFWRYRSEPRIRS